MSIAVIALAKELGMRSPRLIHLADEAGVRITRVAGSVSNADADTIRKWVEEKKKPYDLRDKSTNSDRVTRVLSNMGRDGHYGGDDYDEDDGE